ncbi:MAG: FAD synthetase family protein [Clostridia bacterium]|nr:FAD synthetase family protein [Clostridia bacterium]
MRLISLSDCAPPMPPAAVALGTFDGVHLGHRALLAATVRAAGEKGLTPCAFTFETPPAGVLGSKPCPVLTDLEEKAALMGECGVDTVISSPFTPEIAARSPEEFFRELLLERLNARHIVIGFHYHFGRRARGDARLMKQLCREAGIGLTVVPPVCLPDGQLVSSSAIRASLAENNRRRAEEMLNRPLSPREEALLGGRYNE